MLTRTTTRIPAGTRRQAPTGLGLAAAALLALLTGCSSSDNPTTASESTTTAGMTSAAAPDRDPTVTTTTTDGSPQVSVTDHTGKKSLVEFFSPSRNIACAVSTVDTEMPVGARCDISQKTWKAPAKPTDCEFDWGQALTLDAKAGFECVSDAAVNAQDAPVLEYGQGVKLKTITCVSANSGITCTNSATGHGFSVSREKYSLF